MNLQIDDTGGEYDGDLLLVNGQFVFVDGQEEIKQHLTQRLRTFLGEWFLDITIGVPYFQEILRKQVNDSVVEDIFVDEILGSPGIVELEDLILEIDAATRELSLEFRANTTDGVIEFNEVLT